MSARHDDVMEANRIARELFRVAISKDECLRVARCFAEGGVPRVVEEGDCLVIEYLKAEQVTGRVRRGIG